MSISIDPLAPLCTLVVFWFCVVGTAGAESIHERSVVPFFERYCFECHDDLTAKGKFSLEGLEPSFSGDSLERWHLVRDQLFFRDMPPEKEAQPSESERANVLAWIRGGILKTQHAGAVPDEKLQRPQFGNYVDHAFLFGDRQPYVQPAPPRLWRLRPQIYDTVVPRLGEGVDGLANGLSLTDGPGFTDYASSYSIDEAAAAPLLANAKKVAAALVAPKSKDRAFKDLVREEGAPDEKAIRSAIGKAFEKMLLRLPTDEESETFLAFYRRSERTGGYLLAGPALLTAVLMQPEVLFRSELGDGSVDAHGRTRLSQRETAFALSYALDNRPVDEFFRAGEALASSEGVAERVRERLVDDSDGYERNPRILGFFREYFGYMNAEEVFKDHPDRGKHDPRRLVADLEMTIVEILKADREVLAELLTTRDFYVNSKWGQKDEAGTLQPRDERRDEYPTAFNLPVDWKWSADLQPVRFPDGERAGVLTHPAWLAAWSGNFDNHPVQRGKWIRTHLLGGTVPDVPIGVDARVPELEHTSFRDRLERATKPAECWRCHRSMDPLGLAFERYDHYGRFQRRDAGQPVDASGAITRVPVAGLEGRFPGPAAMMEAVAVSPYVEQVFVRNVFRYFMGRNESLGDANTLQDAHRAYRESGGSFDAVVISLLSSDSFLLRQAVPRQ